VVESSDDALSFGWRTRAGSRKPRVGRGSSTSGPVIAAGKLSSLCGRPDYVAGVPTPSWSPVRAG